MNKNFALPFRTRLPHLWYHLLQVEPEREPVAVLGADVVDGVGLVHQLPFDLQVVTVKLKRSYCTQYWTRNSTTWTPVIVNNNYVIQFRV